MDFEHPSGRPAYLLWLLPSLVLVGGLALTALIAPRSMLVVDQLIGDLSRFHHDQLTNTLSRHLSEALAEAEDVAQDPDFPARARAFLDDFPGIAGLELMSRVSHAQRPMIERSLSQQSGQFIRFTDWDGRFDTGVAAEAPQYLIVRRALFQPDMEASAASLGLVVTTVPHWRGALRRALEEMRPTATTMTELARNGNDQKAVRLFVPVPGPGDRLVSVVIKPEAWLSHQLTDVHDARWQVELHDISTGRFPDLLASVPVADRPASDVPATRSTLFIADRQWMLSTMPGAGWLASLKQQVLWPAWLTGLTITLLASVLTLWAVWMTRRTERLLAHRTLRARHLGQQLDNTRVEKNILHHSLQESDRRTRDLIELGAGMFAELDENRHIGYISPQSTTLLDMPSAELGGRAIDTLFDPSQHTDLAMAFDAARRDQTIQRLDTEAITRDGRVLPVALRIKALKDPLSGCSGFRVSLTPRQ